MIILVIARDFTTESLEIIEKLQIVSSKVLTIVEKIAKFHSTVFRHHWSFTFYKTMIFVSVFLLHISVVRI